ncbi:MAG: LPS export ABC transporter ATP-binding protein [Firmicutes bacterium]|nr:LPS export ABC transporter ATP-binding protein [Bacillota bacterium]
MPAPDGQGIVAEGLVKAYRARRVVDGVSFTVNPGEVVGLLGPNGAGKTTTFYMVLGLERADAGRVFIRGTDVTHWPIYRRARLGLAYLSQEPSVFRQLSVEDNIRAILQVRGLPKEQQKERLEELIQRFHLEAVRHLAGQVLSGGERRRTEVARCLAGEPRFLLLDEPFAGVDPIAIGELQEIIASLRQEGMGILITDHNVRDTLAITDRAYILHQGRTLVSGPSEAVASDPVARRFYLGDRFSL